MMPRIAIRGFLFTSESNIQGKGGRKMVGVDSGLSTYIDEIAAWRRLMDDRLTASDGWLTLAGLHWLHEGENSLGSDPKSDVALPEGSAPERLGVIDFADGKATLRITADELVTVDDVPTKTALLRDDAVKDGASKVRVRDLTFFVIRREDQFGIRVRDLNNPARAAFTGRRWFPIDPNYRANGVFTAHEKPRKLEVVNSVGLLTPMNNVGSVTFDLLGQTLKLEAFEASEDQVWFIFKDATSGPVTYGAGRFLYGTRQADNSIIVDFNRAYHPPCAFTPYATCPFPPRENILTVKIEAGEHL
jgi:uncharacterized protein